MQRMEILEKQIQRAWDVVMNKFYHPKTHMIYDYLTKETAEASAKDYPTPEEIAASAPNPCGWGVGMEDSTLNLGSMIEAMLARYSLTKEAKIKEQLQMLLEGLIKNGTAAEPGFVARSICALDGESVYIDFMFHREHFFRKKRSPYPFQKSSVDTALR